MTTIIGITGLAGAGKDTAAAALVRELGFTRVALGDAVKEAVTRLNPKTGKRGYDVHSWLAAFGWDGEISSPTFLPAWDLLKSHEEPRRLLQVFGTEVGRQMLGEDIWLNVMLRKASSLDRVVVPDVRFANEAQAINDAGGMVIGLTRPGLVAMNSHSSEALEAWGHTAINLPNDETVDVLGRMVVDVVSEWIAAVAKYPQHWVTGPASYPHVVPICPDCRAGKHDNCDGRSWCTAHDHSVPCPCPDISH